MFQCQPSACPHRSNLDVGDGDVEELVHVGVPDDTNIGHYHGAQVSLVTGNIVFKSVNVCFVYLIIFLRDYDYLTADGM